MRQLGYTMFISYNRSPFHFWWKEHLIKHQKVSKYYENDCSCFWVKLSLDIVLLIDFWLIEEKTSCQNLWHKFAMTSTFTKILHEATTLSVMVLWNVSMKLSCRSSQCKWLRITKIGIHISRQPPLLTTLACQKPQITHPFSWPMATNQWNYPMLHYYSQWYNHTL